jgi:cytochrome c-type biogenesis protein CcsB
VPVPVGGGADQPIGADAAPPEQQRSARWWGIGQGTFVLGTVILAVGVVLRGVAAQRVPWANMYEFAITGSLLVAVAYLVVARRYDVRAFALWVTGVLLLTIGLAVTVLYVPAGPLVPALRSPWLVIHVAAATIAAAVFTIGMVASSLYLVRETADRRGVSGRFVSRLPSAAALDRVAYRVTAFGFPIWTFAVIAGAIWAEYAWGRYWGWDPKETWSLITWIVYAAYLHARTTAGWRGRKAAVVSLVAYATLLFNFFGVNIAFVGLHSYGGL